MKKLMLIINPVAGRGGFKNGLGEVLELFYTDGCLPTVYMTDGPGNATALTKSFASNYDLLVCMGGDGTLSEVISGLMCLDNQPILGYIPMGTANDVASTLSLPRNPVKAAQSILSGTVTPLDVGSFNTENYFTYIAAFGAFTEVSYETPQVTKHTIGHLAYLLEGLRHLPGMKFFRATVEHDEGSITEDFLFGGATNSTSVAGLVKLDKNVVELGDGLFEVILIKAPSGLVELNGIVADILTKNYQSQNVTVLHSKRIRFAFENPVAWTRDGENGGLHQEVILENHHGAIRMLVPQDDAQLLTGSSGETTNQ